MEVCFTPHKISWCYASTTWQVWGNIFKQCQKLVHIVVPAHDQSSRPVHSEAIQLLNVNSKHASSMKWWTNGCMLTVQGCMVISIKQSINQSINLQILSLGLIRGVDRQSLGECWVWKIQVIQYCSNRDKSGPQKGPYFVVRTYNAPEVHKLSCTWWHQHGV